MAQRGEIVKEILREQGRSQMWLARQLKCSAQQLNHWLVERRPPPPDLWESIARILGVPAISLTNPPRQRRKAG